MYFSTLVDFRPLVKVVVTVLWRLISTRIINKTVQLAFDFRCVWYWMAEEKSWKLKELSTPKNSGTFETGTSCKKISEFEIVSRKFKNFFILSAPNPPPPPLIFSLKLIHLLFQAFRWKHFWICLNLDFLCRFKVALEVLHDRVLGSLGRHLLMTSTQKPNTMTPQSALCIWSRKWKSKLIVPMYFGTITSKCSFKIISFSSLESELSFDSEDSEINFEYVRQLWTHCLDLWKQMYSVQFTGDDRLIAK